MHHLEPLAPVLLALTLAAPSALAQGNPFVHVETSRYGQPTPVNDSTPLDLCLQQDLAGQATVHVHNGTRNAFAGVVYGAQPTSQPFLNGTTLLVDPVFNVTGTYDDRGAFSFPTPLAPSLVGIRVYLQAFEILNNRIEFSHGVQVDVVQGNGPTSRLTGFDKPTATELYDLASWVYGTGLSGCADSLSGDWELVDFNDSTNIEAAVVRNPRTLELAVAFQGTEPTNLNDWGTNVNMAKASYTRPDGTVVQRAIHQGFRDAYRSIEPWMDRVLARELGRVAAADRSRTRLSFTGHSLGGALATVAAMDYAPAFAAAGFARNNLVMYSFAAPRALTARLSGYYDQQVPHHWVVANTDDVVTHLPISSFVLAPRWVHPNNMFTLANDGTWAKDDGDYYGLDLNLSWPPQLSNTLNLTSHFEYAQRLDSLQQSGRTSPWVSMYLANDGNMGVQWNYAWRGGRDFVALYDQDPRVAGPDGHLFNQWQRADSGNGFRTNRARSDGYWVAYVQQNRFPNPLTGAGRKKILAVSGPFRAPAVQVRSASIGSRRVAGLRYFDVRWDATNIGADDYVALYSSYPTSPTGYVLNWRKDAIDGPLWQTIRLYRRGYYMAYVRVDSVTGQRRILARRGPTQ